MTTVYARPAAVELLEGFRAFRAEPVGRYFFGAVGDGNSAVDFRGSQGQWKMTPTECCSGFNVHFSHKFGM